MENKKTVSFKVEQEKWNKLKIIAINKNIKLNQMLEDMVNGFVEKESK